MSQLVLMANTERTVRKAVLLLATIICAILSQGTVSGVRTATLDLSA